MSFTASVVGMNRPAISGDQGAGGTHVKAREIIVGVLLMVALASYGGLAAMTLLG